MTNLPNQVRILMLIRVLRMFMITMPVIVLYWQSHGLSLQDIFILQVIYSLAVVILEVPSGYLADKYGYRQSMIVGTILGTAGFFLYWAWPGYWGFLAAELLLALAASAISGTRDAMLFATLKALRLEDTYTKVQGNQLFFGNLSEAVAAVLAGIIAWYSSIETVLFIQWLVVAATIPLALQLRNLAGAPGPKNLPFWSALKAIVKEKPALQSLNLLAGAISASTLTMVWFAQPHWNAIGVPILYFGYLWAGLNVLAGIAGNYAYLVERYLTLRTILIGFALWPIVAYALLATVEQVALLILTTALFWVLRGVTQPILQDVIQRNCADHQRATVLSINQLYGRLIFSVCSPFLGYVADVTDFATAFLASAVVFGLITMTALLLLLRRKAHINI